MGTCLACVCICVSNDDRWRWISARSCTLNISTLISATHTTLALPVSRPIPLPLCSTTAHPLSHTLLIYTHTLLTGRLLRPQDHAQVGLGRSGQRLTPCSENSISCCTDKGLFSSRVHASMMDSIFTEHTPSSPAALPDPRQTTNEENRCHHEKAKARRKREDREGGECHLQKGRMRSSALSSNNLQTVSLSQFTHRTHIRTRNTRCRASSLQRVKFGTPASRRALRACRSCFLAASRASFSCFLRSACSASNCACIRPEHVFGSICASPLFSLRPSLRSS